MIISFPFLWILAQWYSWQDGHNYLAGVQVGYCFVNYSVSQEVNNLAK